MSLRINTNVSALTAYQNLNNNQNAQADAIAKLSSGLRINKASDDAAGLSISQGLTSQINGLTQAVSNAQDGINVAQIADGALNTASNILQRMRTLTVQANNGGTMTDSSIGAIGSEVASLNSQLSNISTQTKFGGTALLDTTTTYTGVFQVGANQGDTITLDLSTAGTALTSTSGLAIAAASGGAAGAASGYAAGVGVTGGSGSDLGIIDAAIDTVSKMRGSIGATQNQLNYTVANLQSGITNVTASRSNITDADLAVEVGKMTQAQILSQAATSVLAQANSAPNSVLKLLQ